MAGDDGDSFSRLARRLEASRASDYGFRRVHYRQSAVGHLGTLCRSVCRRAAGHSALWNKRQRISKEQGCSFKRRTRRGGIRGDQPSLNSSWEIKLLNNVDWLQWPAMVVTVIAAWLIGSQQPRRRMMGFWAFIASNVLWVVWGWPAQAYALIILQMALFALNLRGFRKNLHHHQSGNS